MAIANPYAGRKARAAKLRKSKDTGSLDGVLAELWASIQVAKDVMLTAYEDGERAQVLKAVHTIATGAGAYAKLFEKAELQAEMAELREKVEKLT